MIDACDRERFPEAKAELEVFECLTAGVVIHNVVILQALLSAESLASVPFLILGNKIDLPHAASEDELRYALAIDTTGKVSPVNLKRVANQLKYVAAECWGHTGNSTN